MKNHKSKAGMNVIVVIVGVVLGVSLIHNLKWSDDVFPVVINTPPKSQLWPKDLGIYGSTQGLEYQKRYQTVCNEKCVPSVFFKERINKGKAAYFNDEDFMYEASRYLSVGIMFDKLNVEQKNAIITKIKNGIALSANEEKLLDGLWYSSIWAFTPQILEKITTLSEKEALFFYTQLKNDFNDGIPVFFNEIYGIEKYIRETSQSQIYLKKMMSRLIELDIIKADSNDAKSLYILIDLKK